MSYLNDNWSDDYIQALERELVASKALATIASRERDLFKKAHEALLIKWIERS